jgi:AraC-like DNA-binding protein
MDILTVIILLGIVHGFFLGFILLSIRRENQDANRVLGILIILFSYVLHPFFFRGTDLYEKLPHLILTAHPIVFLLSPLFLFYVKTLTSNTIKFKRIYFFHLIPFIFYIIYLIPFFLKNADEKIRILQYDVTGIGKIEYLIMIAVPIQVFGYLILAYRTAKKYNRNLKDSFSSIEKINLDWIQTNISWFFVLGAVMTVNALLYINGFENFVNVNSGIVAPIIVVLIIYSIGYQGLLQPEIFMTSVEKPKKYKKTNLESDKAKKYLKNLISYMESEKPYIKNNLTLKNLSEMSAIPYYHLSRIINENLEQNFFDFVNRYRIEEAKEKLLNPDFNHYSILGIAQDVGFNSKSAFNVAFKKYTDKTPSQFRSE